VAKRKHVLISRLEGARKEFGHRSRNYAGNEARAVKVTELGRERSPGGGASENEVDDGAAMGRKV